MPYGFPLPPGDVALPLGNHLSMVTTEKYIDVFSLLYYKVQKKDKEEMYDREKEIL